jgi:hypothetical protein
MIEIKCHLNREVGKRHCNLKVNAQEPLLSYMVIHDVLVIRLGLERWGINPDKMGVLYDTLQE